MAAGSERQRLRRVLSRFKKNELPGVLRWLGRSDDVSKRRSKRDIISSTLDTFAVSYFQHTNMMTYTDRHTCMTRSMCEFCQLLHAVFQETRVSEHAITELELQCKLIIVIVYYIYQRQYYTNINKIVFVVVDIQTHPNSLQWKAYSLNYANGKYTV